MKLSPFPALLLLLVAVGTLGSCLRAKLRVGGSGPSGAGEAQKTGEVQKLPTSFTEVRAGANRDTCSRAPLAATISMMCKNSVPPIAGPYTWPGPWSWPPKTPTSPGFHLSASLFAPGWPAGCCVPGRGGYLYQGCPGHWAHPLWMNAPGHVQSRTSGGETEAREGSRLTQQHCQEVSWSGAA